MAGWQVGCGSSWGRWSWLFFRVSVDLDAGYPFEYGLEQVSDHRADPHRHPNRGIKTNTPARHEIGRNDSGVHQQPGERRTGGASQDAPQHARACLVPRVWVGVCWEGLVSGGGGGGSGGGVGT